MLSSSRSLSFVALMLHHPVSFIFGSPHQNAHPFDVCRVCFVSVLHAILTSCVAFSFNVKGHHSHLILILILFISLISGK